MKIIDRLLTLFFGPRRILPRPVDCGICGSPGVYEIELPDGRREVRCSWCYPTYLRRLAGDPR